VANPLFLVSTLLKHNVRNVTLIDMGGVERDQLDIAHVISCEVMRVPCQDGWVQGLNDTAFRSNAHDLDPGLSRIQIEEIEWLLRQRDCSYQSELEPYITDKNGGLTVLHRDSLWKDCEQFDYQVQQDLRNTTWLLHLIQSHANVGPEANRTNITAMMQASKISAANQTRLHLIPKIQSTDVTQRVLTTRPQPPPLMMDFAGGNPQMILHLTGMAMIQHIMVVGTLLLAVYRFRKTFCRLAS
jgi:hypothetical protein